MKDVAVLGGGPAGAHAAECLARAGFSVRLFDEKLAWEKPCGGGLTYKAYSQYPFLRDNQAAKRTVSRTVLAAPGTDPAELDLDQPLLIYSRQELNSLFLDRAAAAGAAIEKTRVLEITPASSGWSIRTQHGLATADFCIVATGARNSLRTVGTAWRAQDTMYALGYYIAADRHHIDIQFLKGLEGYIWIFPRCGHLSAGICGKGESAQSLRTRLERYLDEQSLPWRGATFYAHVLPALDSASWRSNRVAGPGWLAVGDSAGLVDPITGEGLYYAIRSADLAAAVLLDESKAPAQKPTAYRERLESDFTRDLYLGSLLARRVFADNFLLSSIPSRMVQFTRRSPRFRALMQDLFAGTQSYETLRDRIAANLNGPVQEMLFAALW